LPGLNLEAETIDELRNKLPGAIEDLLEGAGKRDVPFELVTSGLVKIPAVSPLMQRGADETL
jgi:hypothetical protein